jgi:hypothetical protein
MAPIVTSAEIGRPAAEVFAYATDPGAGGLLAGSASRAGGQLPPILG